MRSLHSFIFFGSNGLIKLVLAQNFGTICWWERTFRRIHQSRITESNTCKHSEEFTNPKLPNQERANTLFYIYKSKYSFLQVHNVAAAFTSHTTLSNCADRKPFSWSKPAYFHFSSSNCTVQGHILSTAGDSVRGGKPGPNTGWLWNRYYLNALGILLLHCVHAMTHGANNMLEYYLPQDLSCNAHRWRGGRFGPLQTCSATILLQGIQAILWHKGHPRMQKSKNKDKEAHGR